MMVWIKWHSWLQYSTEHDLSSSPLAHFSLETSASLEDSITASSSSSANFFPSRCSELTVGTVSVLFKTSFGFSIALFSLFASESDPACQGDEKKARGYDMMDLLCRLINYILMTFCIASGCTNTVALGQWNAQISECTVWMEDCFVVRKLWKINF